MKGNIAEHFNEFMSWGLYHQGVQIHKSHGVFTNSLLKSSL